MMKLPRLLQIASSSLFVALWFSCTVVGQTETATVSGLVTDRTAAAVSGAEVRLQSVERGTVTNTTTNDAGIYVFPSVQPGQYQISIQKQGFKQVDLLGLVVNVQDHIEQNFRLEVGSIAESVTVEAATSMINTTDASVSTVVDQSYIKNMPLNGRSFQDLILLTPGTVTQSPQNSANSAVGQHGEFSVNGQRPDSNYYTVDGVSGNVGGSTGLVALQSAGPSGSVAVASALGTTQALVSVDDLQEFRVQSSTYSAEYGHNPCGQFSFETKSGTNQWHGTAYDYLRNGAFDARDWFNDYFGLSEPALRQNDFGSTLGGPVRIPALYNVKDKSFFFVSYEGLRLAQPHAATVNYVPDMALRANAPAPLDQALNAFPVPNGPDVGNGVAQYIGSWSTPASLDSTSVRFDHVVNDKLRLFFRFSDTPSSSTTRVTYAQFGTPSENLTATYVSRSYTAGATTLLSSRFGNDFRINYRSNQVKASQVIDNFAGNTPLNLTEISGLNPNGEESVLLFLGAYFVSLEQQFQSTILKQWNLVDIMSLSSGRHQLKFGIDYRRSATILALQAFDLPYLYFGDNAVNTNSAFTVESTNAPVYPLFTNFSAFAQDEWRASGRLSFSWGLRWEVNPAPGVTQGFKPFAVQGSSPSTWALAPQGTPLWQTAWYNFAPRLGAAGILHNEPGWETVARGGVGVFFDTGQQLGGYGFSGPDFSASTSFVPVSFPQYVPFPSIVRPPPAPYSVLYPFAPHLQLPYTLQWNSSLEQALGKSQSLTLSYVGSHGVRLLKQAQFRAPNPSINVALLSENGLTSDYSALQGQFRRRLTKGLSTLTSYTWSHCIDYGSQNYFLGYQRGPCDFDVRHNLSAAFSYDLPDVGHSRFASTILHHWGVDDRLTARTSFPVILNGHQSLDPNTRQIFNSGLNLVPGQPVYLYGANCASVLQGLGDLQPGQGCPGGRAVNPNAFTVPTAGLGNAPRNFVRGFGAWQMDLAIRREFPLYEALKLQFRAEAFNIFNHPSFGLINPNFGTSSFGQATGTLASTLGILNPLYQMGGPRSMQFALKLRF